MITWPARAAEHCARLFHISSPHPHLAVLAVLGSLGMLLTAACTEDEQRRTEYAASVTATGTVTPPSTLSPTVTPLPSPTPAGSVTATATIPAGQPAAFRREPPAALPNNHVVWVEMGCFQCDGPTAGLRRVYQSSTGRLSVADVLPRQVRGARGYISGMAFAADGSDIVIGWCESGNCGPAGQVTPGARTTLYRSRDGGITYDELARFTEVYDPVLISGGQVLVGGPYRPDNSPPEYRLLPANAPVRSPATGERRYPITGGEGEVWWSTPEGRRFVDGNGSLMLNVRGTAAEQITSLAPVPGSSRLAYQGRTRDSGYTGLVERDGAVVREFVASGTVTLAVMLDERTGTGNASVSESELGASAPPPFLRTLPALINLDAGTITPLAAPFLEEPFRNGRNTIRAAVRGAFARIRDTGSCLNLRERPNPAALVAACAADGVLGRVQAVAQLERSASWYNLLLPDGRQGWASGDYLEQ